ncbi:formate dehydrogenase accessory sulfurtransferase FdhD [Sediminibacillus massiliensis]|uniref:formate dehydrogenase accessory sulfurtransferase FdhD n=1 Tax=Sediminibacillus massiliensis TaxID=1926277 RepID=UPI0009888349|nr:formate dehydrogenase accessory sulfurtransferase FdhD [Sediminibacillus massiliensis]
MKDNSVMKNKRIIRYDGKSILEVDDDIANEFPLTIFVNGEEFATMVCTPTYLEELIKGFLASEGIIRFLDEIDSFTIDEDRGFAYVELKNKQSLNTDSHSKRFIGSCCGKSRQFYFQNDAKTAKTIMKKTKISVDQCIDLMKTMQEDSTDFHSTGGLHNAALCTRENLLVSRSDIGRHNALDKVYGYCLDNRIPLADKVIAFSGRISSEVLLKVSKIGAGIILSKSAPTTLALDLAEDLGITTVGFIRGNRLNVYTHPERIEEITD